MESVVIRIEELSSKKDLTIHYGNSDKIIRDIIVTKEKFCNRLRYFKKKEKEIEVTGEVFIYDKYSFETFNLVISAIEGAEIKLTNENYEDIMI